MQVKRLMPIPEKSYVRMMYLGRLNLLYKEGSKHKNSVNSKSRPTLEEMMKDIWKEASAFNRENFISGHLACSKSLLVVQLLEGEKQVVESLMERIRKDPRVSIEQEYSKELFTMSVGWQLSMCYTFEITSSERTLILDDGVSVEAMFNKIKNTYQARKEKLDIPAFYKHIIECVLLKYMSRTIAQSESEVRKSAPVRSNACNIF